MMLMLRNLLPAIFIIVSSSTISVETVDRLIIWNVGQGLWASIVTYDKCVHIDTGGERVDWKKVNSACGDKSLNAAYFSHWDLDHISFVKKASQQLRGFCIHTMPAGPSNDAKIKILSEVTRCLDSLDEVREVTFDPIIKNRSKANDFSRVFFSGAALFPGDSTSLQEKRWAPKLNRDQMKILILGHHGSKTSTSRATLDRLRNLKFAIASARKKRYGHPHRSVIEELKNHGVSTLGTEQWNNIIIELR